MKNRRTRLQLSRETIRELATAELKRAGGGLTGSPVCDPWTDPPPRLGTEHTRMCTDPWPPPPPQ